mmetsp:Transcript_135429/g.235527  ORF Transcript_135429/g.235527 Transcript_135429/m.235527 type:complete len:209 (-) Transcript_135429:163-789(-)
MIFRRCCFLEDCGDNEQLLTQTSAASPLTNEFMPTLVNLRLPEGSGAGRDFTTEERKTLNVPADFSVRSVDSASTGSGYVSLTEEQKAREMMKLQNMIREFVKEVLQGVFLDVVLEDGQTMSCRCCMDNKLTVISLQVRDIVRQISMTEIQEICSGKELRNLRTTTPLDDLCTTLVMSNDQCVSFKFKDVPAREHFATCMKVLRLALE